MNTPTPINPSGTNSRCVFVDRREGETITVGGVTITVKSVGRGGKVRLACVGPRGTPIEFPRTSADQAPTQKPCQNISK